MNAYRERDEGSDAERARCAVMPASECAERCDWFCVARNLTDGQVDELVASDANPGASTR